MHEVVVPVSVTTNAGKPVENLVASDFIVLNDGEAQTVRMLSRDSDALPIHAVIVLEANDASGAALAKIKKVASIISTYITNDMELGAPSLAAVVTASDEVQTVQDFTAQSEILNDVFTKLRGAGAAGRLLDGVSLACDMLVARKEATRKVIVLISESRDRQSKALIQDVIAKAQKSEVVIYTLSYSTYATAFTQKASDREPLPDQPGLYDPAGHGGGGQGGGGMNLLAIGAELARLAKVNIAEALAQATGGAHGKFTTLRGLETQLSAIGTEVHNRYTLTFVPPESQPAGYHLLSVHMRNPSDARVHARAGYWAAAE